MKVAAGWQKKKKKKKKEPTDNDLELVTEREFLIIQTAGTSWIETVSNFLLSAYSSSSLVVSLSFFSLYKLFYTTTLYQTDRIV